MTTPNDASKVRGPSIRLSTVATSTRQTPKTDFGTVMRDGLIKAGDVAMDGLKVAAPFIPGSAIVSAAVAGANIAGTVGNASYGGGGGRGVASAGLTAVGGGPGSLGGAASAGNYGATGALAIPGKAPGLGTNIGTGSNFSGSTTGNPSAGGSDSFNQMMGATQAMAEFQASFNLQYLQLQEKIQQDTRQFNLVSNIMKTKHDAAKNALNNVR
ncbi:MAG: hypothetical protein U1E65_07445 [Myxococcota bacterium]